MELINNSETLNRTFLKLMRKYNHYCWSVAWAGIGSEAFHWLKTHPEKIEKIVVGLHFYQTHPDFIESFLNNKNVKFIKQTEGTFHPKVYLFYNSQTDWSALVGSANFTFQAFANNNEAVLLFSQEDDRTLFDKLSEVIKKNWQEASTFSQAQLIQYCTARKRFRPKMKALAGFQLSELHADTVRRNSNSPFFELDFVNISWQKYYQRLLHEGGAERLDERLRVLEISRELFESVDHFRQLDLYKRKFIAGLPNQLDMEGAEHWEDFGSMRGDGMFHRQINQNNQLISDALDHIPLNGPVTEGHYRGFVELYTAAFDYNTLSTPTRLLAMKRPDIFFCFTSRNRKLLCEELNLIPSKISIHNYWEFIVEGIACCEWYYNPNPQNARQRAIAETRAAMIDVFFYE